MTETYCTFFKQKKETKERVKKTKATHVDTFVRFDTNRLTLPTEIFNA